jgi:hypothetical protein
MLHSDLQRLQLTTMLTAQCVDAVALATFCQLGMITWIARLQLIITMVTAQSMDVLALSTFSHITMATAQCFDAVTKSIMLLTTAVIFSVM